MYGHFCPGRLAAALSPPKHPTPKARLIDRLIDYFNQVQANPYPGGDPAAAHEE
jgi:hypothetical protein